MLSFPWKREETDSMSASLCFGTDTSQTEPVTSKPESFHFFKHSVRSCSFLAQVWTLAPNPVNSSTMARLLHVPQEFTSKIMTRLKGSEQKLKHGCESWNVDTLFREFHQWRELSCPEESTFAAWTGSECNWTLIFFLHDWKWERWWW